MEEVLVSKAQMLDEAERAGLGTRRRLDTTFVHWQELGLLGHYVGKEQRRGGAGLWHPLQLQIWLALLRNRAAGTMLPTLANVPVGAWLLWSEGVEVDQAQRAFGFWIEGIARPQIRRSKANRREAPRGPRSVLRRATDASIGWLAHPEASDSAKRRLRKQFELMLDFRPEVGVSPDTFAAAVLGVIAPGREPSMSERQIATNVYLTFELRFRALRELDALLAPFPEVQVFWMWAKRFAQKTVPEYQVMQPKLAKLPDVGRFADVLTLDSFMNRSCNTLLLVFGMGIGWLEKVEVPPGVERPPELGVVRV